MSNVVKSTFRLGPLALLVLAIPLCFTACAGYIAHLSGSEETLSWMEVLLVVFLVLVCCFVLWGLLKIRYRVIIDPAPNDVFEIQVRLSPKTVRILPQSRKPASVQGTQTASLNP